MSRGDMELGPGGFPIYGAKQLPKLNALRRANSTVGVADSSVPVLDRGQAQYVTSEQMGDIPCSCYRCTKYNHKAQTCSLIGPRIPIRKFVWPKEATDDAKKIEYWPACGAAEPGSPNVGEPRYREFPYLDPDNLGLCWINAPRLGLEYSGANCGGVSGGDDCDLYLVERGNKWDSSSGFCRVLQSVVAAGDVCSCWSDDDQVDWRKAIQMIRELDGR